MVNCSIRSFVFKLSLLGMKPDSISLHPNAYRRLKRVKLRQPGAAKLDEAFNLYSLFEIWRFVKQTIYSQKGKTLIFTADHFGSTEASATHQQQRHHRNRQQQQQPSFYQINMPPSTLSSSSVTSSSLPFNDGGSNGGGRHQFSRLSIHTELSDIAPIREPSHDYPDYLGKHDPYVVFLIVFDVV